MYKVLASCGAGIGSSMIIKKKIQKVFDKLGHEVEITHESIGTAKNNADKYDLIFTLAALAENFEDVPNADKVIGLRNIMSENEIEAAVHQVLGV